MRAGIIRKSAVLLTILLLRGFFFAPPGRPEGLYSKKLVVKIKVKPVSCLRINKETIKKILAEYEGHLRGIALREYAKERVARFRLTNVEGRTYTELMPAE